MQLESSQVSLRGDGFNSYIELKSCNLPYATRVYELKRDINLMLTIAKCATIPHRCLYPSSPRLSLFHAAITILYIYNTYIPLLAALACVTMPFNAR